MKSKSINVVQGDICLVDFNPTLGDEIKKISRELKADRLRVKSFGLGEYAYTKEEIKRLSKEFLADDPKHSSKIRYEEKDGELNLKNKKPICELASSNIVILVDGGVSMCCYDLNGEYVYGNVLEQKLESFWKSEEVSKKREMAKQRKYPLCKICAN